MKKTILVRFKNSYKEDESYADAGSTNYSFFTDLDAQIGDMMVADTVNGLKFVQVVQIEGLTSKQLGKAESWIICALDLEAHAKNVERQLRAQEIMNKIDAQAKKTERLAVLTMMAKGDPEMRKLMSELNGLDSAMMPSHVLAENTEIVVDAETTNEA